MTLLKKALIAAGAILLCACSDHMEQAQERLISQLPDRKEVEFQNLERFSGDVVCGEYRNFDPMRGGSGFHRFIVWGERVETRPSDDDWNILCSEDPSAALTAIAGIGPVDDPANQLAQIRSDLALIEAALAAYLADNFFLPSTAQGLDALVAPTTTAPLPRKFKPGGYLAAPVMDPWDRPYLYERSGLGGVAQEFRLYTLGADGAPGGTGKDADVGLEHMKYIDHIAP
ncbi:MAG: type II secretion system protein GspG [Halieaceae bacterium]|jgi:type II secretion system protein G|nr:type II secretion system protein GspG [Halieaceae bacterium]